MLVGMSPEPWVAQTTRNTSCALRSAEVAALSVTSTAWPAASSTGFSASATIWALPDSVPTRIRILDIAAEIGQRVPRCDATGWRGQSGDEQQAMPVSAIMDRTPVIAALEAGVLTLMLNRPQRLNAMNN